MSEHSHRVAHAPDVDRLGARLPSRFDPKRAARLDDRSRLEYLPPERILALDEQPEMLEHLRSRLAVAPAPNVLPLHPSGLAALSGTSLKYHFLLPAERS